MIPTDAQIREWCNTLAKLDLEAFERSLLDAARRLRSGSNRADGFPTSTAGGGRGGGELTSVEAAVDARLSPRDPEVDRVLVRALDLAHQAATSTGGAVNALQRAVELASPEPPPGQVVVDCCEPFCEDPADPGRAGRCEPCYRSRYRWAQRTGRPVSEAPPITRDEIAARLAERDRRRRHVTGPLAEGAPSCSMPGETSRD